MDRSHRNVIDRVDLIGGAHRGRAGRVGPVDDIAEKVIVCDVGGQRVRGEAPSPGPEALAEHARTSVRRRRFPGSSEWAEL